MTTFVARSAPSPRRRQNGRAARCGGPERARVTIYDRDLYRRIIVDNFAGFGGAGHGIERAAGRPVDVAINHCPLAIEYHTKNSPGTLHLCSSVWEVDPDDATGGRGVALAWFSPDCRHFSRAKGKPKVDKRVRSLAWVVIKWATRLEEHKRPDVIILENVREFETWGPLIEVDGPSGRHTVPDPERKGETFRRWWRSLERAGYVVEKRVLNAADFGAPTIRKRLFIIARRDGKPIRWPEATHGPAHKSAKKCSARDARTLGSAGSEHVRHRIKSGAEQPAEITGIECAQETRIHRANESAAGHVAVEVPPNGERRSSGRLKPYRTAAECIDWSLPVKSIFERARPLAEKTQRRIAMGIWRYLINSDRPFLVRYNTEKGSGDNHARSLNEPLGTVVTENRYGLVVPTLVSGYGERDGQEPRARGVEQPAPTVPASGKHALAAAMLVRHCQNGSTGKGCTSADEPIGTMVTKAEHSLINASLVKFRGDSPGVPVDGPVPTITSGAGAARPAGAAHALGLMGAALVGVGGRAGCSPERAADRPMGVVTTKADTGLAAVSLARFNHGEKQWNSVDAPLGVIATQGAGGKFGLVYAFLAKYYSCGDNCVGLDQPMPTVTTKDRVGLVTVTVERPDGSTEPAAGVWLKGPEDTERQLYLIADIGLRMLTPRELARAQGFPDSFVLPPQASKAVRLIGNSVPPPLAEAIVRANFPEGVA